MTQEFAHLNCATCHAPLEETGKMIRNVNTPGPFVLCTQCQTYYQMFYEGEGVYIVPLYRDYNQVIENKKARNNAEGKEICDCSHVKNNHVHRGSGQQVAKECCECTCKEFETDKRTLKEKIAFSRTVDEFLSSIYQKD